MSDPTTPTELRDALFTAILQEDADRLMTLCNDYGGAIVEHFATWTKVPPEVRGHEQSMQAWAHCLMTLARLFEDNGVPDLMERLTGGADNPIVRWRDTFARASALAQAGDYEASSQLLANLSAEMKGAQGDIVDDYLPKAYGLLGTNAFHLGRHDEAVRFTRQALDDCRRSGDTAGVRAYTENLRVLAAAAAAASTDEASVRLCRIRASLARAQDLSDDARFDQSNDLLEEVLAEIAAAGDRPGREYRGKALGLLGLNCLRLGDSARARTHTTAALEDCRTRADGDGVRIYTANLAHLDRVEKSVSRS